MLETATEERTTSNRAFDGNLLLSTFSTEHRESLEPFAESVELDLGQHIQTRGSDVEWSYFPYGTTMISLVVRLADGRSAEVASIGREGAVGASVANNAAESYGQAIMQIAGLAVEMSATAYSQAYRERAQLRALVDRFQGLILLQAQQSAACHALHGVELELVAGPEDGGRPIRPPGGGERGILREQLTEPGHVASFDELEHPVRRCRHQRATEMRTVPATAITTARKPSRGRRSPRNRRARVIVNRG